MLILDNLIAQAPDKDVERKLRYLKYLYNDLLNNENEEMLNEYTEALVEAVAAISRPFKANNVEKPAVSDRFRKYLVDEGKNDNTAYNYSRWVERICKERAITLDELYARRANYSIEDLIGEYSSGGKNENDNKKYHNGPLSSLKRFRDFMGM